MSLIDQLTPEAIRGAVKSKYSEVALNPEGNHGFRVGRPYAEALGYPGALLDQLPASLAEAFTGVAAPALEADVRPGQTVVDLGCGGGLDLTLLALRAGRNGRAIGIDFAPEMVDRARRNLSLVDLPQLELHLGEAERLPLQDGTADWVVANGILNLSSDKQAILAEIRRVLKPDGVLLLAETALQQPLPPEERLTLESWFR